MKKLIIAIDGPSGAGKSTAGKKLATQLHYLYIDTGAMYRAVALRALEAQIDLKDEEKVTALVAMTPIRLTGSPEELKVYIQDRDVTLAIRRPEVSQAASIVSSISGVRRALVAQQRRLGENGGVVLDGRDIGTHVFPQADIKFFLQADLYERARRRNLEEGQRGERHSLDETLQNITERDKRDSQRTYAPLRPADDAIQLNTSQLSPAQVVEKMLEHIDLRWGGLAKPYGC
jgi:cytidylate kinase